MELHRAPAETDDATAVWLPQDRLLYGGAATIMSIPNVGTPLRSQRDPMRWARTLDHYITLEPDTLVREFGPEVQGGRPSSRFCDRPRTHCAGCGRRR